MSNVKTYGELQSERRAKENETCRKIVREISNFGVSQRQMLMVVYLLALELENHEQMKAITSLVKEIAGDELFLANKNELDDPPVDG